jgi:hypothetical protein
MSPSLELFPGITARVGGQDLLKRFTGGEGRRGGFSVQLGTGVKRPPDGVLLPLKHHGFTGSRIGTI